MSQKILFLTPQLPYPPHQGTTLRNFGLIKGLAVRGHRITLLSFIEPGQPAPGETPLHGLCERIVSLPAPTRSMKTRLLDLLLGRVDMTRRLWSEAFMKSLVNLMDGQSFDIVHFEGIEMAAYLQGVAPASGGMLIYDAHNAEYALQERTAKQDLAHLRRWHAALYSMIQARRLRRFETRLCQQVDHVVAVSGTDAGKLKQLAHQTPITVIPNAINMSDYQPGETEEIDLSHPAVVFTGKMDFRPNVDAALWFAEEILPLIQQSIPDVHFTIVGQKPHARLETLRTHPGITLTGWVEAVQPYINAADVYVVPLRMGSGTRLKLLEAMAMECAIVSTRIGAEGFDLVDGEYLSLADTPEAFAGAVISLLEDPTRRVSMGKRASRYVRQYYDWPAIIPSLEAIYPPA